MELKTSCRRFLGVTVLIIIFAGCNTPPPPSSSVTSISIPPPPPPIRLLTLDILKRAAPEALQYYISAWIILEYEGIPNYPDTITVRDVITLREDIVRIPPVLNNQGEVVEPEKSYQLRLQDPRAVNPGGVGYIQYESLNRIILIKEQTRGVLLNTRVDETDGRTVLEIGFERDNNNTLTFKEDALGEYFYLDPAGSGTTIQYGGHAYRQLMRERPLLMVRIGENIENTLRVHTVEGRIPAATPPNRSSAE